MSTGKPEQWSRQHQPPSVGKKFAKKQAARHMRRLAKKDPENAPTRYNYHGWIT